MDQPERKDAIMFATRDYFARGSFSADIRACKKALEPDSWAVTRHQLMDDDLTKNLEYIASTVEAAGSVLDIVGLIGTFKNCVDLFSYFSASRSLGRDYEILEAKLDVEKALLLRWADKVRLVKTSYDSRLVDHTTHMAVSRVLSSVQLLLSESSALQTKYGLQEATEDAANKTGAVAISRPRMARLVDGMKALKLRIYQRQENASQSIRLRWIIADKEKFDNLIQKLSHFVSKLDQIIPSNPQLNDCDSSRSMARDDINAVGDLRTLGLIRDATFDHQRQIADLADEKMLQQYQRPILDHVWFRTMDDRRDGVSSAHNKTLEWALDPPHSDVEWDDLSQWFRLGRGIYWLSGKAGSGKSTLMKYLRKHPKTKKLLLSWAGKSVLNVGSFFFWNLGTLEQKSHYGLSRALLFHILESNPRLIPKLRPRTWQEAYRKLGVALEVPSIEEVAAAFETLSHGDEIEQRVCFFIDGLDEYSGNYMDGITFIKQLCEHPDIKVVVSSRPIPACVYAFADQPKLQLQDLTKEDISRYVYDTVGSCGYMADLLRNDPIESNAILGDLVNMASGVFLWVVLACRSLIDGFASCDKGNELRRRMEELPPELEDMFQHMLNKVDSRYHSQAAKILSVCYRSYYSNRSADRGFFRLYICQHRQSEVLPAQQVSSDICLILALTQVQDVPQK